MKARCIIASLLTVLACLATPRPSAATPEWRLRNPAPLGDLLIEVVAGPAGFVALGESGGIYHSEHGAFWSPVDIPSAPHLRTISTQGGSYVAIASSAFFLSSDAATWREVRVPDRPDGTPAFILDVGHAAGRWSVLQSDSVLVSADATTWSALPSPSWGAFTHFAAGAECILILNSRLRDRTAPPPPLPDDTLLETVLQRVTYDGTWEEIILPGLKRWTSLGFREGRFVAIAEHATVTSADGRTWTTRASTLQHARATWTGSRWVMWGATIVEGSNPPVSTDAGLLLTSTDGETWSSRAMTDVHSIGTVALRDDGVWLVGGRGIPGDPDAHAIATSLDGTHWQQRLTGSSPPLRAISRIAGRWIAGGDATTLMCSDDGLTWRKRVLDASAPHRHILRFAVVDSIAYAYTTDGVVYASQDGLDWETTASFPVDSIDPAFLPSPLTSASTPVWAGDQWLATGTLGVTGIGFVITSADRVTWRLAHTAGLVLTAAAGRPGTYVVGGALGDIYASHDGGQTWELVFNPTPEVFAVTSLHAVDGWFVAGTTRGIYVSSDGDHWERLAGSRENLLGGAPLGDSLWLTGNGGTLVELTTRTLAPVANVSARATIQPDRPPVIGGFVVEGTESVDVLVRAVGAGLRRFAVDQVVQNPTLHIYRGPVEQMRAGDWAASPQRALIETVSTRVGAFPLDPDGGDSAVLLTVGPGVYTAIVSDLADPVGDVLVEVYDANPYTAGSRAGRLVNSSTRGPSFANHPLIGGFVVRGDRPRRLLVRGVGPGLAALGVAEPAANPTLTVFRNGAPVAQNDEWHLGTDKLALADAFHLTGAFAFADPSHDAALLLTLAPGEYTAHVDPSPGTAGGEVLMEVYYLD